MVATLAKRYPQFQFVPADIFAWSPDKQTVMYNSDQLAEPCGTLALLHELAHAQLGHQDFSYDIELMRMEIEAWGVAKELAPKFGVTINDDYIHQCLESYREWMYKRSRCPECHEAGVQQDRYYHCIICGSRWRVTPNRHTHPYRIRC